METEPNLDDIDVAIRFEAVDAQTLTQLQALFADEDVLATHAFSGMEAVTVIATLTAGTIGKLLDFFAKKGSAAPRTSLEIGKRKITITGFSRADMETLLASPDFKSAIAAVRAK